MKLDRTRWTIVFLAVGLLLSAWWIVRRSGGPILSMRFATFNVALNRSAPGALLEELKSGESDAAQAIAEIVQRVRPDVLLLNELDRDVDGEAVDVLAERYLAVSQGGAEPVDYRFRYFAEVNTGEPSGLDLDVDGRSGGPGDAFGFGAFPGQYGMALLSRFPILTDAVRSFRQLLWKDMPDSLLPADSYDQAERAVLRLSSKSHWDLPIVVNEKGDVIHVLASHPTPPVFDGPEDRNGRRNYDEIRLWTDYITMERGAWIVDDAGRSGGLRDGEAFVIMGDLNADPNDGDSRPGAMAQLLEHPRVQDPRPTSKGAVEAGYEQWGANSSHKSDAALDTGDFDDEPGTGPGNLRLDYVLPSNDLEVFGAGVYWPPANDAAAELVKASDHRLVWVDVRVE